MIGDEGVNPSNGFERPLAAESEVVELPAGLIGPAGTVGPPDDPEDRVRAPRTRSDMLRFGGVALGAAVAGSLASAQPAGAVSNVLTFFSAPVRVYDSRQGAGKLAGGSGNIGPARQLTFTNTGIAIGFFGNLSTTQQEGAGFLSLWPGGTAWPGTASINFVAGVDLANYIFFQFGPGGTILLGASQNTHVIIDVTGFIS
jgi:hypothetical protein